MLKGRDSIKHLGGIKWVSYLKLMKINKLNFHIISEISLKFSSFVRWDKGIIKKSLQKFSIEHPPKMIKISFVKV